MNVTRGTANHAMFSGLAKRNVWSPRVCTLPLSVAKENSRTLREAAWYFDCCWHAIATYRWNPPTPGIETCSMVQKHNKDNNQARKYKLIARYHRDHFNDETGPTQANRQALAGGRT